MSKKSVLQWLLAAAFPFAVTPAMAAKRVVVDKGDQMLRAYDNGQLVFASRVSTGKPGKETPNGTFSAKSKKLMHHSSRYHNAPMPHSVNYSGHYFIHGYSSVPPYPASNGCIRLPLAAAPKFYQWVTPGTPITVTGKWTGPKEAPKKAKRGLFNRSSQKNNRL